MWSPHDGMRTPHDGALQGCPIWGEWGDTPPPHEGLSPPSQNFLVPPHGHFCPPLTKTRKKLRGSWPLIGQCFSNIGWLHVPSNDWTWPYMIWCNLQWLCAALLKIFSQASGNCSVMANLSAELELGKRSHSARVYCHSCWLVVQILNDFPSKK